MWDVVRELMLEEVHRVWRRLLRRGPRDQRLPSRERDEPRPESPPLDDPSAKA